jgi:hypothetical protein
VKTGEVIGECLPRHRAKEFIRFLKKINRAGNRGKTPGKLPRHGIHSRLELCESVCLWPNHPAPLMDLASMN